MKLRSSDLFLRWSPNQKTCLIYPLMYLNMILKCGDYFLLNAWIEYAKVIPVYKSGYKSDDTNYRSISTLLTSKTILIS